MDDAQIYQLAKFRLAETQQAIIALAEAGMEIPAEAYEMCHIFHAAVRWYEELQARDPSSSD